MSYQPWNHQRKSAGAAPNIVFSDGLPEHLKQPPKIGNPYIWNSYPKDWPTCPGCGEPVIDGKSTCGDVRCG